MSKPRIKVPGTRRSGRLNESQRKELVQYIGQLQLYGASTWSDDGDILSASSRRPGVYRGTRKNIHNETWRVYSDTADGELRYGELASLRQINRQLVKDNPVAEGTIIAIQEMAVGDGPYIETSLGKENAALAAEIQENIIEPFSAGCDVTGERTLNDIALDIVGNSCVNGDVLITLPADRQRKGLWTFVELIEADRIDTPVGSDYKPIRHGVQYDEFGRLLGYWVRGIGMSEQEDSSPTLGSSADYRLYPRLGQGGRLVSWLFKRPVAIERPRMSRQVPLFSSCIWEFQQLGDLLEATVVGERVAACIMGAIKSPDIEGFVDAWTRDQSDQTALTDENENRYTRMSPGTFLNLKQGEEASLLNPQRNGGEVVNTLRYLSTSISMKVRIPYAILFLDLSQINYSSYRGGILEARRMLRSWRSRLEHRALAPILNTAVTEAYLRGMVPGLDEVLLKLACKPRINWPAWGFIDPQKEVDSDLKAIQGFLTSPQIVLSERGYNWRKILADHEEFEKELKARNLKRVDMTPEENVVSQDGTSSESEESSSQQSDQETEEGTDERD